MAIMAPWNMLLLASLATLRASGAAKPNIIFVLTDDQDVRLNSFVAMPKTRALIQDQGANISNFFIHTPICCPSRTTLLSGRFEHNNRVDGPNAGGCMRMNTSQITNPGWWQNSVVKRLHDVGYTTGIFGKMLNTMSTYGCNDGWKRLPDGVDRLMIMCGAVYDNATWADYGAPALSANTTGPQPGYTTSYMGNKSVEWIKSVIAEGPGHKPFFAYVGPHAPHLPSTPAPWYKDHPIGNTPLPKAVYYNYSGIGKHSFGRPFASLAEQEPSISESDQVSIQSEHGDRLRTLLSVDDVVEGLVNAMPAAEWANTYFLYCSDHGYSLGQFRIDSHKTQVYDHNTRVPMLIKGPGITPGSLFAPIASMADLAPTMLELAAGGFDASAVPEEMDGGSFAPMLTNRGQRAWKHAALIEYQSIRTQISMDEETYISTYGYRTGQELAEGLQPQVQGRAGVGVGGKKPLSFHAHDGPNNTFSAIRIINTTATPPIDLLYAEFADVTNPLAWHFAPDQINFHELYDVSSDYYMLDNIYWHAGEAVKAQLHAQLQAAIKCKGATECFSVLA